MGERRFEGGREVARSGDGPSCRGAVRSPSPSPTGRPGWQIEWHLGGEGPVVRYRLPRNAVRAVLASAVLGGLLSLGACLAVGGERITRDELAAARALQRALNDRATALDEDLARLERRAEAPRSDAPAPQTARPGGDPPHGPGE